MSREGVGDFGKASNNQKRRSLTFVVFQVTAALSVQLFWCIFHQKSSFFANAVLTGRVHSSGSRQEANMSASILDWAGVIAAIVLPFLAGAVLEHRLYPIERQWAARLGR